MKHILVYADSLSWGIVPGTRQRLAFEQRWPGVLELGLQALGEHVRIIEDCLNGRRTAWDDPYKPGRNGQQGLAQRIEIHSPLDLVILMLGTNDFQSVHDLKAWHAAQGVASLIDIIRRAPIEPGMPVPPILVVTPPALRPAAGPSAPKFAGGDVRCAGLSAAYAALCAEKSCAGFDAGTVVQASAIDGVHLDADQHLRLGQALLEPVRACLQAGDSNRGAARP